MRAAAALREAFARSHGAQPAGVLRAPGRVNLIGEHLDYNGFAVLPMAIDRSVLAAWRPRPDGRVCLASLDGYPERSFALESSPPPYGAGDWGNYAKAAASGLAARLGAGSLRGVEVLVTSTLPASAGLSSSTALVVLFALALLAAAGLELPPLELAALLAEAEKYVGTQGGGMDHAACLLGRAGRALRVDFRPLRVAALPLFPDHAVVVANSLVRASKAESRGFNLRATECRLAAARAARCLGRPAGPPPLLADLLRAASREQILAALPPGPVSAPEAGLPEPAGGWQLLRRARHVLSESARVEAACGALSAGDAVRFGELMNESHASCRDDYEISRPELERLVELARGAGAAGARLTGAGFGGCVVALVERDRAERLLEQIARGFYGGSPPPGALFEAGAADGAGPVGASAAAPY